MSRLDPTNLLVEVKLALAELGEGPESGSLLARVARFLQAMRGESAADVVPQEPPKKQRCAVAFVDIDSNPTKTILE
jgi:hypothetical protein